MSRPSKDFQSYIIEDTSKTIPLSLYEKSPATAFLKYLVNTKDASVMCDKFKNGRSGFSSDALESIQIINAGLLATIMGNFETFQKYLFAQMFEYSINIENFNIEDFLKRIKIDDIDLKRLSAYRKNPVGVGLILADNLEGWSNPQKVNCYFQAFNLKRRADGAMPFFYDDDTQNKLKILWQMRHSIVHTAATITKPDAEKVKPLVTYAGKQIALQPNFIYEVARKMHPIIKKSMDNIRTPYIDNLKTDISAEERKAVDDLFKVSSPCSCWLR